MITSQATMPTQTMIYQITHTTLYKYAATVPECFNTVRLQPRDLSHQRCVSHELSMAPLPPENSTRVDPWGNTIANFSIYQPHNSLKLTASSRVEVQKMPTLDPANSMPWETIATDDNRENLQVARFKTESKHIRRSSAFADYALISFTAGRPIVEAGIDLTQRIFTDFDFSPGVTTVSTPVEEVFANRKGVCQDFAHFQIACLRSIGLPARYVSGYVRTIPPPGKERLVGADASHAWISLYCGDMGWISFDPTNNSIPDTDHITLAWGRDYFDVCPIQGVFIGGGKTIMSVEVDVEPLE
ncbi:transglutaminase family protein [bacterium]|nr:transglutaminase family protein [bacterium]